MLRVFDSTARYVDQGGGKRKGAFAIYLEPWHADVFDFLELKKNHGKEEVRMIRHPPHHPPTATRHHLPSLHPRPCRRVPVTSSMRCGCPTFS